MSEQPEKRKISFNESIAFANAHPTTGSGTSKMICFIFLSVALEPSQVD